LAGRSSKSAPREIERESSLPYSWRDDSLTCVPHEVALARLFQRFMAHLMGLAWLCFIWISWALLA